MTEIKPTMVNPDTQPEYCEDCYETFDKCTCPCPQCDDGEDMNCWESACIDDLCHGGEVPCMHGDYARLRCGLCGK